MTTPQITAPSELELPEDADAFPIVGLTVSSPDPFITVLLRVNGTLSLGSTDGLNIWEGDPTGDSLIWIYGNLSNINAALATLTYTAPPGGGSDQLFINAQAFPGGGRNPELGLASLHEADGLIISAHTPEGELGYAVDSAGDINGDGIADFMVSAPNSLPGEVHVVFGNDAGFSGNLDLDTLDGTNGFTVSGASWDLNGEQQTDRFGHSMSSAGDVNGDGIDDLIFGASEAGQNGASVGAAYVVYGTASGFDADLNIADLDGTNGFAILADPSETQFGYSVSSAGDMNGDGIDDIIVGHEDGSAYVLFGDDQGFSATVDISAVDGTNGFRIELLQSGGNFGSAVSSAGDVNGDGFDDVIVGSSSHDFSASADGGSAFVVYGQAEAYDAVITLPSNAHYDPVHWGYTDILWVYGGGSNNDAGTSVSNAGDFNGDGIDDFIVGAPGAGNGQAYVIFGSDDGLPTTISTYAMNGTNGVEIVSRTANSATGFSVSNAGDFNGDGISDLLVGAPSSDIAYVVFGSAEAFPATLFLEDLDFTQKVELHCASDSTSGASFAAVGDINGDGFDDIIVGANSFESGDGAAYIVYGSDVPRLSGANHTVILNTGELPTVTVPDAITMDEGADGHAVTGLSVADTDSGTLLVNLSALNQLSFGVTNGLTFTVGDGTLDSEMVFTGSVADINAALATLTYHDNGNGTVAGDDIADTITLRVTDGAEIIMPTPLIALSSLDGTTGFTLFGEDSSDVLGHSVSSAGDVNGDGFDDVIVGARSAGGPGNALSTAGEAYVLFGTDQSFAASVDPSSLDGTNGFTLVGAEMGDRAGFSVSSAGDVNGDGFDDVIVGAPFADGSGNTSDNAGEAYVVFGTDQGFAASIDLGSLDGTNGFALVGVDAGDNAGFAVSSAGDVNGDGLDDVIVGAYQAEGSSNVNDNSGEAYVVFGTDQGFAASIDLGSLDGTDGFTLMGIEFADLAGYSVSSAGDVNGDGFDDVIVGAPFADSPGSAVQNSGAAYVVFGTDQGFAASIDLGSMDGTNGFGLGAGDTNDYAGWSVSSAGDVNGDGFDDLIVGAGGADGPENESMHHGETYILFGSDQGFAASIDLDALDGTNGFIIVGADARDEIVYSVSSAGDVNGDGIDDVIIGAEQARNPDNGNSSAGEAYVVFGTDQGFAPSIDLRSLDGTNGFTVFGEDRFDNAGRSVSAAGDVNEDGYDDIIVGSPNADGPGNTGFSTGEAYIIYGGPAASPTGTIDITLTVSDLVVTGDDAGGVLEGLSGDDDITGGTGSDILTGGAGSNTLDGGGGNDRFFGGEGMDAMIGGVGRDLVSYVGSGAGITITLDGAAGTGGDAEGDTLSGIENIFGSNFGDTVTGSSDNNIIRGFDGDDVVDGGAGNDSVFGDAGNDTVNGGQGNDRLYGGEGTNTLNGGTGNDLVVGGIGADAIDGGDDFDTVTYANSAAGITITMGGGPGVGGDAEGDTLSNVERVIGSGFDDVITGSDDSDVVISVGGADNLSGGAGNDILSGALGNDILDGGSGDDRLFGGADDDILTGGIGRDFLNGGAGSDTFVFNDADVADGTTDRIFNYEQGSDTIDLTAIDASSTQAGTQSFTFIGDLDDSDFSGDGTGAELGYAQVGNFTRIQADVDGDGVADWTLDIVGSFDMTVDDFALI